MYFWQIADLQSGYPINKGQSVQITDPQSDNMDIFQHLSLTQTTSQKQQSFKDCIPNLYEKSPKK
jgi:hypothetical protein